MKEKNRIFSSLYNSNTVERTHSGSGVDEDRRSALLAIHGPAPSTRRVERLFALNLATLVGE